jgi:hypothetical protein
MKPASCFRDLASFSNRQKRLQQNRRYAVEIHNGTILERVSWLSYSPSRKLNRISGRTSAQQWIVRRGNSVRQHEGIEIDVARWTGVIGLDTVDGQRSHVDLLPVRRPRERRVIGRISRLTYSNDKMPLQRVVMNARNQRIE